MAGVTLLGEAAAAAVVAAPLLAALGIVGGGGGGRGVGRGNVGLVVAAVHGGGAETREREIEGLERESERTWWWGADKRSSGEDGAREEASSRLRVFNN